jgi:hypothetical protein
MAAPTNGFAAGVAVSLRPAQLDPARASPMREASSS